MNRRVKIKDYDMPYILEVRKIIDDNPKLNVKITDLAQKVGINECKLKYGFKEIFKKGVHQYRLSLRLQNARDLLEGTDRTIEEIAYAVGFESRDGFSNAFKKEFKRSPRHWRNELLTLSE
ncbi:helix-turn-helix domain-containing protein [Flavitalea flava]